MFFTYRQNNTGGNFVRGDYLNVFVIIEADTAEESDMLAERVGIYFDGCNQDIDCPCCGDRWHNQWDSGDVVPSIYGMSVEAEDATFTSVHDTIIYRKDGTKTFSVSN